MTQKSSESDLTFITRVGSIAHLCEFDEEKKFEEIVATVAEHARSREVRTTALKMLSRKCNFTDLVDKVREIEAIRLNEEFVMRKHGKSDPALVAPVRSFSNGDWNRQRRFAEHDNRGGGYQRSYQARRGAWRAPRGRQPFRGRSLQSNPTRGECCWRCGGIYHSEDDCRVKDKICNKCGCVGHIQRTCTSKRPATEASDTPPSKIAVLEKSVEDTKVEETVSDNTDE